MALQDFIKDKEQRDTEEIISKYEQNCNKYASMSSNWTLRITADELGMSKEDLQDILENYYEEE